MANAGSGRNVLDDWLTKEAQAFGPHGLTVKTVDGMSCWTPGSNHVEIGLFNRGDSHDLGEREWLAAVFSEFIHEISHPIYSRGDLNLVPQWLLHPVNLLEDVRAEARFVAEHPQVRPWLRHNALGFVDDADVEGHARTSSWAEVFTTYNAREMANVVEPTEAAHVIALSGQSITPALAATWQAYCSLSDSDSLNSVSAIDAATQLEALL